MDNSVKQARWLLAPVFGLYVSVIMFGMFFAG